MRLRLGAASFDLSERALVVGVLNRTPDSFFDQGSYFGFDQFLCRAEQLVQAGADLLDIGGVKAGPGPEVSVQEELDRVVPAVEAVLARFDVPVSVDTWRAAVAEEAFRAGAVMGNDISGFADPDYLAVAARHGAAVVACHIRLAPRVPDPDPSYADLVGEVEAFLAARASWALQAGVGSDQVVLDAGLDLGKTPQQSLELLRASRRLAGLGFPLMVSASNKPFLGSLLGLGLGERRTASWAAAALAVSLGARLVRAHDVAGTKRVCSVLAALEGARG